MNNIKIWILFRPCLNLPVFRLTKNGVKWVIAEDFESTIKMNVIKFLADFDRNILLIIKFTFFQLYLILLTISIYWQVNIGIKKYCKWIHCWTNCWDGYILCILKFSIIADTIISTTQPKLLTLGNPVGYEISQKFSDPLKPPPPD